MSNKILIIGSTGTLGTKLLNYCFKKIFLFLLLQVLKIKKIIIPKK